MTTEKFSGKLAKLQKSTTLRKNEWHWVVNLPHNFCRLSYRATGTGLGMSSGTPGPGCAGPCQTLPP